MKSEHPSPWEGALKGCLKCIEYMRRWYAEHPNRYTWLERQ